MDSISIFHRKIEEFLRKYYRIQIYKGGFLIVLLSGVIILLLSVLEHFGWYSSNTRFIFFSLAVTSILFIIIVFFGIPFLRFFGILKRISNKRTALILKSQIPEIKDYVSNIFELENFKNDNSELVIAALNQKIAFIKDIDFLQIYSFKDYRIFLKYLLTLFLTYLIILIFSPNIILDSGKRIINFSSEYVKDIGFSISINEEELYVEKGDNINVNFSVLGEVLPSYLSIFVGNNEYLCDKVDSRNYSFYFKNVNNSIQFRIGNDVFKSKLFTIEALNVSYLKQYNINVESPQYLNKPTESFTNPAVVNVHRGSNVQYIFNTLFTDSLIISTTSFSDTLVVENNRVEFSHKFLNSSDLVISGINENSTVLLIPKIYINVIPDNFPEIEVQIIEDEKNKNTFHFKGIINDDYGFSGLNFCFGTEIQKIEINNHITKQQFFVSHEFDEDIEYYFEVFDNDTEFGPKRSSTEIFNFKRPSFGEYISSKQEKYDEISKEFEKSVLMTEEIKKDLQLLKEKLFSESLSSFEKKNILNSIENKQNQLQDFLNKLTELNKSNNANINSFNKKSEEVLEKQAKIEEMMDEVLNDEIKNLIDELNKITEELSKDKLNDNFQELDLELDELSEELDRNMELLKKFKVENDILDLVDRLNSLSENLKEDNFWDSQTLDSLARDSKKELNKIDSLYNSVTDENLELENGLELDNFENEFQDNDKKLENIENSDNKTKDLNEVGDSLEDLANKMANMINNNRQDENGENAETLRQILENLIYFSFEQEINNLAFSKISNNSPSYLANVKIQSNLNHNFSIIKDSLMALSKRTPELGNHISDKVFDIEKFLISSVNGLNDRKIAKARVDQRFILEKSNDLILLLSESLKNMDNAGSGSGAASNSKRRKKPKQGEPSLSEMRKSQESMKSQLEGLLKDLKKGSDKSGGKSSQKLGQLLSQQEVFQNMLNKLKNGKGTGSELGKTIDEVNKLIEQNKRDIINQRISRNMLERQNQIVTKLLEAENASIEREKDDKRKSEEAVNKIIAQPNLLFDDIDKSSNFNEILNKSNFKLDYFYQSKYKEYLNTLENK